MQALPAPTRSTLIGAQSFNHQRTRLAPETTPATAFVARLFMFFTTTVTWGGRQRRPVVQACHQAPARASFAARLVRADFGGWNTEASPLPILFNILPFGFVSVAVDWQGLVAPFIFELFAIRRLGGIPREVFARFLGVGTGKLQTPASVLRTPARTFTPIAA